MRLTDGQTDERTDRNLLARPRLNSMQRHKNSISSNYVVHAIMFYGHLSYKMRKNYQINSAQKELKCTFLKF